MLFILLASLNNGNRSSTFKRIVLSTKFLQAGIHFYATIFSSLNRSSGYVWDCSTEFCVLTKSILVIYIRSDKLLYREFIKRKLNRGHSQDIWDKSANAFSYHILHFTVC